MISKISKILKNSRHERLVGVWYADTFRFTMKDNKLTIDSKTESNLLNIFKPSFELDENDGSLIELNSELAKDTQLIEQRLAVVPESKKYVLLIIDDSKKSLLSRLVNIVFRKRTIQRCFQILSRAGFEDRETYAVYPSLERITFVYPINTAASNYAENFLIETVTSSRRLISSIFRALGMGSPFIEVIAVTGQRK